MKQRLLWIPVPSGVSADGKTLFLSVLVAPQLDTTPAPSATLAQFPDMLDWPSQSLKFSVKFGNGPSILTASQGPPPTADFWQTIFKSNLPVTNYQFDDFTDRKVRSYPVVNVINFIKDQYSQIAVTSPTDLPPVLVVGQRFGPIATVTVKDRRLFDLEPSRSEMLETLFKQGKHKALPPGPPDPEMDFFQAKVFHGFRGGKLDQPPVKPDFDFHQAISLLGDHPTLLRRLGLLIDLSVPFSGQAPSGVATIEVSRQVRPGDEDKALTTQYVLDHTKRRFLPAPKAGSELKSGMVDLSRPEYSLIQVDPDGAALKTIDFANQLIRQLWGVHKTADSDMEAGLPTLRSGGISLVRTGRAVQMVNWFVNAKNLNAAVQAGTPLTADELVRGFRVDIEEELPSGTGTAWRSLCQRRASYKVSNLPGQTETPDEGIVTGAFTQAVDPNKKDLFMHETLFHWDGWSLAAPRPDFVVNLDGETASQITDNPSETPLDIEVTSKVLEGSLPKLRFGKKYRMRARVADSAGNDVSRGTLPLANFDETTASAPVTYRRFEPVEAPAAFIVTDAKLRDLPGEALRRLVIRSENSDPSLDTVASPEASARLLLPPRTSVQMVEQLGKLDLPSGGIDVAMWPTLAAKDSWQLKDVFQGLNLPDDQERIQAGIFPPVRITPGLEVLYLPDPLAKAAVLRGLPGASGDVVISFETAPVWHGAKPFQMVLVEGTGAPDWDPANRVLTVRLSKAETATVRLSCQIDVKDLDKLAIWNWMQEAAFDADDVARLQAIVTQSAHWMLTPFREISLVHAVIQPLALPAVQTLLPKKLNVGHTFAALEGEVAIHAKSTGKIDLYATWSEPTGFGFERKNGGGHAFEVPVHNIAADGVALGDRHHEFGDPKHRHVKYSVTATTRFRDCFVYPNEPPLDSSELTRSSLTEFEADVLNSGRPLAPNLLYVIPTFGWESGTDHTSIFSKRKGGLRVYLNEPWFSSGDGELLGVVLWLGPTDQCGPVLLQEGPLAPAELQDRLKPYATQWGRDPIWLSGPTHALPSLEHFTRAAAVESNLTIEELPNTLMAVAGHEVGYDETRHLFYCDIDIDAGPSYYPFVRLALARYQPKSIPGAEVSRIVLADFAQFAPDRMAWIMRDPQDPDLLKMTVSGAGYRKNKSFNCAGSMEVRLERWLSEEEGDIGWVPVLFGPLSLQADQTLQTLTVWTATFHLPPHRPDARFRLIFEEYESFLGDPAQGQVLPDGRFGEGRERRLVYSDAVEI